MFLLLPLGRVEEATRELSAAQELDPVSSQTHSLLTIAFRSAGRFDEAAFHFATRGRGTTNSGAVVGQRIWSDNGKTTRLFGYWSQFGAVT
jgi:hypothetical protein